VEGILVFGKAFSFAGGAGTRALATSTSQPPLALKRSGGGRRGGRDSNSFAAAMVVTKNARRGNRGGELTQCGSPSLLSVGLERFRESLARGDLRGQPRWQSKAYAFGKIFLARCGCSASSETEQAANARERQAPRGARRSDAGEDIGARGCARTSNLVCRSR